MNAMMNVHVSMSKGENCHRSVAARAQAAGEASSSGGSSAVVLEDEKMNLGKSDIIVPRIGIGAWSWGDRSGYWGWKPDQEEQNKNALKRAIELDIAFVDTAEVYGFGLSETLTGKFIDSLGAGSSVTIATKFAPLPWRLVRDTVPVALRDSLERLQMGRVDLYMIHWPGFFFNAWSNNEYIEGLANCYAQGMCRSVGVSNFNAERIRSSSAQLVDRGIPLASNQIQYSLLYRKPETNGVLQACRENGVTPVAYSPLCQGLLTGKYRATGSSEIVGQRAARNAFSQEQLAALEPLLGLMTDIGSAHGGKTPTQVALNWTVCKGALPIPGVKTPAQVEEAAGALGWRLTEDEQAALEKAVDKLEAGGYEATGAPFENW